MPPELALFACVCFILWLFIRELKVGNRVSIALWIPLIWALLLATKPVSSWLGVGGEFTTSADQPEGSPLDAAVWFSLIVSGFSVLLSRRVNWQNVIASNKWLIVYFLYFGMSALWSDYPFVSFKRWIKDIGNVVMVLLVLSDDDPIEAVKAVLARCSYLLIPLSILFVKYYPDLGRYYDYSRYENYICGVTSNKNILGMTLLVCGLFLFWVWIELWSRKSETVGKIWVFAHLALALMTLWLALKSECSTSLGCIFIGVCIILGMRHPAIRSKVKRVGFYGVAAVLLLLLLLHAAFDMIEVITGQLGRDMTLTGRVPLWEALLREKINPFVGTGYYSFWLGDRMVRLNELFSFHPNEAHNAYLETYLNGGLFGLFLLIVMLASAAKRVMRGVKDEGNYGVLRFAFLAAILTYSITEAVFNRLSILWFVLLLVITEYPRRSESET
jgi:exopolysaccharide production protein ExoQ